MTKPGGWWGPIAARCTDVEIDPMPASRRWLGWATGMVFLYGSLVGTGHLLTGRTASGITFLLVGAASGFFTLRIVTEYTSEGRLSG